MATATRRRGSAITPPGWTTGPSVGEFFESSLRHVKGPLAAIPGVQAAQPFRLHESQQADIDLIYEVTAGGARVWRDALWSVSKGYGKTPIAGGIGLLELMARAAAEVYIAAGSKDQAGVTQDYARKMVDIGPLRAHIAALGRAKMSPLKKIADGGIMRPLAADGDLAHGNFPAVSILDELWVWVTEKQESMHAGLLGASQKVADSLMLTITTVGVRWATLLGELFETLLATMDLEWCPETFRLVGRDTETSRLMIWRTAPTERIAKIIGCDVADPADPAVWRKCNPGPWIADRDLRRLAKTLPAPRFRQLILNQWPDGKGGTLLKPADWDACGAGEDFEPIAPGAPVWLGVSISPSREQGALVAVSKRSDGQIVTAHRIFAGEEDALKTDLAGAVRWAASRWDHQSLAADRWQFGSQMTALAADGIRLYKGSRSGDAGMPQTDAFMVPATGELVSAVTGGRLEHDGDRVFGRQVKGLEVRIAGGRGSRLARPAPLDDADAELELDEHRSPAVVEAGFALAMALYAMASGKGQALSKPWAACW